MLQAFAPVVRGQKKDDPVLLEIAKEVGKSWNHVLLRYGWQKK
jgi:diketogulonate reductase-like aldo/keto reductase